MHVHVQGRSGEAKFWVEPEIELAHNHGMREKDLRSARQLIEERVDEIRNLWQTYFSG